MALVVLVEHDDAFKGCSFGRGASLVRGGAAAADPAEDPSLFFRSPSTTRTVDPAVSGIDAAASLRLVTVRSFTTRANRLVEGSATCPLPFAATLSHRVTNDVLAPVATSSFFVAD